MKKPGSAPRPVCSVLVIGAAAEGLGFLLRRRGYHVSYAEDAEPAVATARAERPDVVLLALDPAAERMDAWLTAERIRAEARRTRIVVYGSAGRVTRGRAAPLGYGVLPRAATPAEILAEIARQARFRRRAAARELPR